MAQKHHSCCWSHFVFSWKDDETTSNKHACNHKSNTVLNQLEWNNLPWSPMDLFGTKVSCTLSLQGGISVWKTLKPTPKQSNQNCQNLEMLETFGVPTIPTLFDIEKNEMKVVFDYLDVFGWSFIFCDLWTISIPPFPTHNLPRHCTTQATWLSPKACLEAHGQTVFTSESL